MPFKSFSAYNYFLFRTCQKIEVSERFLNGFLGEKHI